MRRLRPYLVMVLALAAVFWAVGCAPPTSPQLGLHGRPAFDNWVGNNIVVTAGDLSERFDPITGVAPCGGYTEFGPVHIAMTDYACIDRHTSDPLARVWIPIHEIGHGVDHAIGFPQGRTASGFERGAQCVAAVVLDTSYSPWPDSDSYWVCPSDQVDRTRQLMIDGGMW